MVTSPYIPVWWEHRPEDEAAMERSREMGGIARRAVRAAGLLWPGDVLNACCARARGLVALERHAFAWACAARTVEWRATRGAYAGHVPVARALLERLRSPSRAGELAGLVAAANQDLFDPELDEGEAFHEAWEDHAVVAFPVLRALIDAGGASDEPVIRLSARDAIAAAWDAATILEPLEDVTGWTAQAKRHAAHASHGAVQHELFLQIAQLDWLESHPSEPMPPRIGDDTFERLLERMRENE